MVSLVTAAHRTLRRLLAVLGLAALALLLLAPGARADDSATKVDIAAVLAADGSLAVTQTLTFDGAAPATITQQLATEEQLSGGREYRYRISDLKATAGSDLTITSTDHRGYLEAAVATGGSSEPVVISYTVSGATFSQNDGDVVARWRVLQGLSVGADEVTGQVQLPTVAKDFQCHSGPPNETDPGVCSFSAASTEQYPIPTFSDGARGPGEVVELRITLPAGAVAVTEDVHQNFTLGHAFATGWPELLSALAALVLGGLGVWALHRRSGRDAAPGKAVRIAEFAPVAEGQSEFRPSGALRPGEIGTLADERVDPIDVTASILDLAVRGHLLIREIPREHEFARADWELVPTGADRSELRSWEQSLLDTLTPDGDPVRVSGLGAVVGSGVGGVQSALYDSMVAQGWYARRPDKVRQWWSRIGLVALVAAVVVAGLLIALTSFGLLALVLVGLALGLLFVSQEMPARTPSGAAVLAGLGALRQELLTQPTDQMPPGRELMELSEVLPYAVVLGGQERWIDAIVAADDDEEADSEDLSWFHGPENWHLRHLPESLKGFLTATKASLFDR